MREEAAAAGATVGLRLSQAKTLITRIDEGLDFLGWRIQRHHKPGTDKSYVYTYPSKKAVKAVTGKVRALSRRNGNQALEVLLHSLNPVLRGWCVYFQPGVSSATYAYLRGFTWRRVMGWLRRKHPRMTWKQLRRRYCHGGWWPSDGEVALFNPPRMRTTRYRYRGAAIPAPGASRPGPARPRRACGEPDARLTGTSGSGGGPQKRTSGNTGTALRPDLTISSPIPRSC